MPSESAPLVLIVDDDQPTRLLLQALMRRYGYATDVAPNGNEAVQMLRSGRYALAILDLMMPKFGGREVLAEMERDGMHTPVIVCTAGTIASVEKTGVVKAVIRKPFDINQFMATVRQLIGDGAPQTTVLVVDDDMRARYILKAFVEPNRVIEADSGDAALELVRQNRPDVILLDLVMPGASGEDVLRTLREHEDTSHIPVVVVTSRVLSDEQRNALLQHASGVLNKGDLSREKLASVLKAALGK